MCCATDNNFFQLFFLCCLKKCECVNIANIASVAHVTLLRFSLCGAADKWRISERENREESVRAVAGGNYEKLSWTRASIDIV